MEDDKQKYFYIKTTDWSEVVKNVKLGYRWTMMTSMGNQIIYGLEKEITNKSEKVELD